MDQTMNTPNDKKCCHHGFKPLKVVLILVLIVFLVALVVAQVVSIQDKLKSHQTITVSGEGKALGIPDVASITFSVIDNAATAKDVMKINAQKTNDIIKFIKDSGVESKDTQTAGYYLNPRYDWVDGKRIFRDYELTSSIAVKIRNLEKISDVIDGVVSRGANQVGDIQFIIDEPEKLKDEARDKAIAQAKEKINKIIKATGLRLGRLISFTESGNINSYPVPMYSTDEAMKGMGGGPTIEQGSQEIHSNVSLIYELQ